MKWFFRLGNSYARKSSWVDFALVKFCLFAMGILVGTHVGEKYKKPAVIGAGLVFAVSYIPLMAKVFKIAGNMDD